MLPALIALLDISIHALVKRATRKSLPLKHGCFISIHALVKRATSFHCLYNTPFLYFNPRPREEGDIVINGSWRYPSNFNPRPREEGDSPRKNFVLLFKHFNPRPREEGDVIPRRFIFKQAYFNPRPREEGDCSRFSLTF